ncbi:hypothetical protein [Halobacillus hunanensis]|uniref:hypothetical protein n=1 Tax=Halobacillus hunanensis TaxID=578214 RepID=UPI0009A66ACF|nr:hypothetical protein [Halobacillus hunanensis]
MRKKPLLLVCLSLVLGLIAGGLFQFTSGNTANASDDKGKKTGISIQKDQKGIDVAKEKVPFDVELPKKTLPFEVESTGAHTMDVGEKPMLKIEYKGPKSKVFNIEITDQKVNLIDSGKSKHESLNLIKGVKGTYVDNGNAQIINFYYNDKNYYLTYSDQLPKENNPIDKQKIIKVAEHIIKTN